MCIRLCVCFAVWIIAGVLRACGVRQIPAWIVKVFLTFTIQAGVGHVGKQQLHDPGVFCTVRNDSSWIACISMYVLQSKIPSEILTVMVLEVNRCAAGRYWKKKHLYGKKGIRISTFPKFWFTAGLMHWVARVTQFVVFVHRFWRIFARNRNAKSWLVVLSPVRVSVVLLVSRKQGSTWRVVITWKFLMQFDKLMHILPEEQTDFCLLKSSFSS